MMRPLPALALFLALTSCGHKTIPGQTAVDCLRSHYGTEMQISAAPYVQMKRSEFRERFGWGGAYCASDGTIYYHGRGASAAHEQMHCAIGGSEVLAQQAERICG